MSEFKEYCNFLLKILESKIKSGELTPQQAKIMYFEDKTRKLLFNAECEKAIMSTSVPAVVINSNAYNFEDNS